MRIAFIVHDYTRTFGHSRYVVELAERFVRDHEVHVFAHRIDGPADARIVFHRVPALGFHGTLKALTFILPATLQRLKGFDIVHAQGLSGLRQNVTTAHFCQAAWRDRQRELGEPVSFLKRLSPLVLGPLETFIFKRRRSQAVIAISQLIRRDLEHYCRRSENVTVIYHGADLVVFHPKNRALWRAEVRRELGLSDDCFLALYVGNLAKGAKPAIAAALQVSETTLLLVSGSDNTPYRKQCQGDDAQRILFRPATATIERYYAAADVFLFPTLYDPFGMVITEAMAAGLPVLTSVSAGAAELIAHGTDGVVIDPAWDVAQFAGWLKRLKDEPDLREKMGRAAREKAERYTWDRTAEETLRVYRTVVAAQGSR